MAHFISVGVGIHGRPLMTLEHCERFDLKTGGYRIGGCYDDEYGILCAGEEELMRVRMSHPVLPSHAVVHAPVDRI